MRALHPGEGPHLPPRGRYATLRELLFDYGYSLTLVDVLLRTGRLVRVGTRYLFT